MHVDNNQRQFGNHSQTDRFALQRQTGTGCGSRSQATGKAGADGSTDPGNFIFRLDGDDAEFLMFRQFMQDIGCRSDRVASEEQPQAGLLGGSYQPVGSSLVPVHVGIETRCGLLAFDTVSGDRSMDIVSVVVTVRQRLDIGLCDDRLFGELVLQHVHRFFQRTFEQPANQP